MLIGAFGWIAVFAWWWFMPVHLPHSLHGRFARIEDFALFLLVAYAVWHPIIMQMFSWVIACQIKDHGHQEPEPGLRVALITTFVPQAEPVELLDQCLPAMLAVDYPHDVWLLDEGDVPEVRDLCQRLGVKHFSRLNSDEYNGSTGKFSRKTKCGNHNSWYDQYAENYDVVAQMDTDFIPKPEYLTRTLGFFKDPAIGFVGTPQIYGNTEHSLVARGAAEQAFKFYGPILRGFSGLNSMIMIGANHVIRVKALQEVDLYSPHITEDLITGMKLHAQGWNSVYVPDILAVGEGPATWSAFFNQQMRWAHGGIDILLKHSPRLLRQMGDNRALFYFLTQQYYFSGLAMAIGLICIGMYAVFGITSVSMGLGIFLELYVPLLLICELMALWMQRLNIQPSRERGLLWAGRLTSIATLPIFFVALIGVLTGRRLSYKVTPKGAHNVEPLLTSLSLFTPHLLIAGYCIACLVISIWKHHDSPIMLFWLTVSAILMLFLPFSEKALQLWTRFS